MRNLRNLSKLKVKAIHNKQRLSETNHGLQLRDKEQKIEQFSSTHLCWERVLKTHPAVFSLHTLVDVGASHILRRKWGKQAKNEANQTKQIVSTIGGFVIKNAPICVNYQASKCSV